VGSSTIRIGCGSPTCQLLSYGLGLTAHRCTAPVLSGNLAVWGQVSPLTSFLLW